MVYNSRSSKDSYGEDRTDIKDDIQEFKNVRRVITHTVPTGIDQVQLFRKIVFYKNDGSARTVYGTSSKASIDEVRELEAMGLGNQPDFNTAFSSCLAQINFSWSSYTEVDRAFIYYEPIES